MKRTWLVVAFVALVWAQGCASAPGVSSYRPVDLGRDLDAPTLERYRAESEKVIQAGQEGHLLLLERQNWWPLGVLAYWQRGSVKAMHQPSGTVYMVSQSRGYGPLSALYVTDTMATFREDGRRLDAMTTGSVLFGHVAMMHSMEFAHAGGRHKHESFGLLHHLVNIAKSHGKYSVSFFSGPNPVGFGG